MMRGTAARWRLTGSIGALDLLAAADAGEGAMP